MAICTRDFTENICITFNDKVYTITECFHLSPIKGPTMVRTILRDIKTGETIHNAFNAAAEVKYIDADKKATVYRGDNSQGNLFETTDHSEQLILSDALIDDAKSWMNTGDEVALIYIEGKLEGIEPLIVTS